MSAKPQQDLCIKFETIVLVFLYLQLLLWSALAHPAIDVYIQWVPKSFFSSTQQTTTVICIHRHTLWTLFESVFFSVLALFGYFCGCDGIKGVGCSIYRSFLAAFEQSMMGVKHKYCWMCLVPWIITFIQNWLQNLGQLLILFSYTAVYEAANIWWSVTILMGFMSAQALLASEVIYVAVRGWQPMKNINDANIQWERNKRIVVGDSLNT